MSRFSTKKLPQAPVRYRWELWLLFGIPAVTGLAYHLAFASVNEFLQCARETCIYAPSVVSGSVRLLLLAVSWRAVRRQGRELLALLWMLETVTAVFGLTVNSVHLALGRDTPLNPVLFGVPLQVATSASSSTGTEVNYPVTSLVYLIVTLWFARRASRISTGHAFLIVALSLADSSFAVPPYVLLYSLTWYGVLASSISLALQVSVNAVMFWAMVRFDASGIPARWLLMTAVLGGVFLRGIASRVSLLATVGFYDFGRFDYHDSQLEGMVGLVRLGLFAVAPLALAWLVRVRQPRRERPEEN